MIQKEIGNKAPMVCYSGALVLGEDGEALYSRYMNGDTALEIKELVDREYPGLSIADSSPYYLEVMDGRVKKSAGVRFLCGYYGITMEQAMAFGDGCNDIDMLKAVKNSYAMSNAPREVRDSAAHVTLDNDHEGLLAALKENFT